MTISGRFVINSISVRNMKFCFKSVATGPFMKPSSNNGLRIFISAVFEIFPSLTNWTALLFIIFRALLAVSQHIFEAAAKISWTSLCLLEKLLRAYSHPRICLRLAVFPNALHRLDVVNPPAWMLTGVGKIGH